MVYNDGKFNSKKKLPGGSFSINSYSEVVLSLPTAQLSQ